ncbi:hypothetical protein ACFQ7F_35200 [Streptomyces sp. NPDC056486]|uniref:hypothetical protein n=1 Tax=Streptomyces sp. NPDC056486 TaxID=3345835 RepID=UPI0036B71486
MVPRRLPLAVALTASAALLLTACGSGDDKNGDKAAGAGKQGGNTASPNSSATKNASAGLPDFELPDDIKVDIEPSTTGDKAKDQILREQAEGLLARQRIFVDLDPTSGYLTRYYNGEARAFYVSEIKKAKADGRTITGTYRYYDRKVTQKSDDRAVVTYCEDQSKAFAKDIKTEKIKRTEPSPEDYTLITAVLRKTDHGTWLVQSFRGEESATECR